MTKQWVRLTYYSLNPYNQCDHQPHSTAGEMEVPGSDRGEDLGRGWGFTLSHLRAGQLPVSIHRRCSLFPALSSFHMNSSDLLEANPSSRKVQPNTNKIEAVLSIKQKHALRALKRQTSPNSPDLSVTCFNQLSSLII